MRPGWERMQGEEGRRGGIDAGDEQPSQVWLLVWLLPLLLRPRRRCRVSPWRRLLKIALWLHNVHIGNQKLLFPFFLF
jgi:hypothetical protein